MSDAPVSRETRLRHAALFYGDSGDYLRAVSAFVAAGLADGEPVFVAVPGPKIDPLRDCLQDQLGAAADAVSYADMTRLGANPARIIPAVRAFTDTYPERPVRYVGEPIWAARTTAELTEAARHEALLNLAFADTPASILCPYDATRLDPAVLVTAGHTHPLVIRGGHPQASSGYAGTGLVPGECDQPLSAPPRQAARLAYHASLAPLRAFVTDQARRAGLTAARAGDLVIAVHELAANTLRHTAQGGTLHIWAARDEVICQVHDAGQIGDPLVGRRRPDPGTLHGQGLWVVQQLCDLVELRTGRGGSTIRLHMRQARGGGALRPTRGG
jgi:anti-sigma regulatory factor (Ser/Thr protein kinase)